MRKAHCITLTLADLKKLLGLPPDAIVERVTGSSITSSPYDLGPSVLGDRDRRDVVSIAIAIPEDSELPRYLLTTRR
jgi:hypothetical protein